MSALKNQLSPVLGEIYSNYCYTCMYLPRATCDIFWEWLHWVSRIEKWYGATHEKRSLMKYANRKGPDQTARMRSLIWAFSVRQYLLQYTLTLKAGNEGPVSYANMMIVIVWCFTSRSTLSHVETMDDNERLCCNEASYCHELNTASSGIEPWTSWSEVGSANQSVTRTLNHMRTAKALISTGAVWSWLSLFVIIYYIVYWLCKRATKALIRRRTCDMRKCPLCHIWTEKAQINRCSLTRYYSIHSL